MKRVLITGAAGDIGSRPRLTMAGRYRLRLSDRRPVADPRAGEEFIGADISDAHAVASLMRDSH